MVMSRPPFPKLLHLSFYPNISPLQPPNTNTNIDNMSSPKLMNHTDGLRIIAILEANHRLCMRIMAKTCIPSTLNDEAAVITKLITDLKDSTTSKVRGIEDCQEDSEYQATIYTPSNSGKFPALNLNTDVKNDTLGFENINTDLLVEIPEHLTMSKVDVIDALAPLSQNVASKDDVLALLKHHTAHKNQITDLRDEARTIDGVNTREATSFYKTVMTKIDTLQKDLVSLTNKVAANGDISALRTHMASQEEREAPAESIESLTGQVAEIHGMFGRFKLRAEDDTAILRQELRVILEVVSAIKSYDQHQVADIGDEIASLRSKLSDWEQRVDKSSRISSEQYNSLKKEIVAAVKGESARQISLLREEILDAIRSSGICDTKSDRTIMESKEATARRNPRTGQHTTTQSTASQ